MKNVSRNLSVLDLFISPNHERQEADKAVSKQNENKRGGKRKNPRAEKSLKTEVFVESLFQKSKTSPTGESAGM
jgi:hypothetical protein